MCYDFTKAGFPLPLHSIPPFTLIPLFSLSPIGLFSHSVIQTCPQIFSNTPDYVIIMSDLGIILTSLREILTLMIASPSSKFLGPHGSEYLVAKQNTYGVETGD